MLCIKNIPVVLHTYSFWDTSSVSVIFKALDIISHVVIEILHKLQHTVWKQWDSLQ